MTLAIPVMLPTIPLATNKREQREQPIPHFLVRPQGSPVRSEQVRLDRERPRIGHIGDRTNMSGL